jgi:branched-chain amino acid transport system substrate-binding protein
MTLSEYYMLALPTVALAMATGSTAAVAQRIYAPRVTDTEIKIGQTMPHSGPAAVYGPTGFAATAYFKMLNAQGGINGRKITFISLDNGYSSPKALEGARRLVEQDLVWAIVGNLGLAGRLSAETGNTPAEL